MSGAVTPMVTPVGAACEREYVNPFWKVTGCVQVVKQFSINGVDAVYVGDDKYKELP
jgi:hypothetical protein